MDSIGTGAKLPTLPELHMSLLFGSEPSRCYLEAHHRNIMRGCQKVFDILIRCSARACVLGFSHKVATDTSGQKSDALTCQDGSVAAAFTLAHIVRERTRNLYSELVWVRE